MTYQVKTVTTVNLYLEEGVSNVAYTKEDKQVITSSRPRIGSNSFNYDGVNKYRFGCESGSFNYKALLIQIKAAQDASNVEVDALLPIKGGNAITTEIVDESDKYYILKTGKAVAKDAYTKGKHVPKKKEGAFGKFTYEKDYWNDWYYMWNGNKAGESRTEILEAMLHAKAIIDFFEDKGDYAPKVEETTSISELIVV